MFFDFSPDLLEDGGVLVEVEDGCDGEAGRGVFAPHKEDVDFLEEHFFHVGGAIKVFYHLLNNVFGLVGLALALLVAVIVDVLPNALH